MTITTLAIQFLNSTKLILAFMLLVTGAVIVMPAERAEIIKTNPSKKLQVFNYKDGTHIKTSDSLIYVGKVEKFLFLYNRKMKAPEIYSTENLVSILWADTATIKLK
jgi:hypothetical protein